MAAISTASSIPWGSGRFEVALVFQNTDDLLCNAVQIHLRRSCLHLWGFRRFRTVDVMENGIYQELRLAAALLGEKASYHLMGWISGAEPDGKPI